MSYTIDGALLITRKGGLLLGKEKGIKQTLLMVLEFSIPS